jgi:hypothetical protein
MPPFLRKRRRFSPQRHGQLNSIGNKNLSNSAALFSTDFFEVGDTVVYFNVFRAMAMQLVKI